MKAYRIVEDHGKGIYKTLFHGIKGSRELPLGEWLEAKQSLVKDGTSKTSYLSGFHSLETIGEMIGYMKSFKTRLHLLKIAEITIKDVRPKTHSNANVLLSKYMRLDKVLDINWQNELKDRA